MSKVSIIIPSRNEPHLNQTVADLLTKAAGEIEIIPVLDGYWPDPPLPDDPRIIPLHRGQAQGMRPAINSAALVASGEYLMKCDAHCMFAEGYDETLKADCEDDWLIVPTRHSIHPETWTLKPRNYNYHILTYPYLPSMYGAGLHAVTFDWQMNKQINEERSHILIDDLMSSQGSCWFQKTANFHRHGPLDHQNYYFYQESQETLGRVWATGGRCVVNKKTWYAHMHKGRDQGRGFYLSLNRKRQSEAYATDFWIHDRWPGTVFTFNQLVEKFWPLISLMTDPRFAWPDDWRDFEGHRARFENRAPEEIPAHL